MERLQKPEGVNILKGQVGAEWVEWGHMAAENTREHRRMLRKKFYITLGLTMLRCPWLNANIV